MVVLLVMGQQRTKSFSFVCNLVCIGYNLVRLLNTYILIMITEEQKKRFHMRSMNNGDELIFAARRNDLEAVKYLMTTEFEYFSRIQSYKKEQALILAAGDGHLDVINYFLEDDFKGDVNVNIKQTCSEALRNAIHEGQIEMVEFFLSSEKTKKYVNLNYDYCFKLAPPNMLEYLLFDYKMDIRPYIEKIKRDPYLMNNRDKSHIPSMVNNYEKFIQAKEMHDSLQNELDSEKSSAKKLKI
jgi:hypothetical protein